MRVAEGLLALLLVLALAGGARPQRAPEGVDISYPWQVVPEDALQGHLMEGRFREPSGVFFDRTGQELFVTDSKGGLVGIFEPEGGPVFTFGRGLLVDPREVVVIPDGTIFVLDSEQDVLKRFSYRGEPEGRLTFSYPELDGEPGGAVRIGAFTIDGEGRFYVADLDRPQVLVYSSELELQHVIRPERGGAAFAVITGLAISQDGILAVTDFKATPVQLFDDQGRFLRGFGHKDIGAEGFSAPIGATFDEDGYLYVVDMLRHHVKIFDGNGTLQGIFGGWFGPGSGGRAPGEMLYPSSVAVAPGGYIYVAERFGNRVQLFRRRIPEQDRGRPVLRLPQVPAIGSDQDG